MEARGKDRGFFSHGVLMGKEYITAFPWRFLGVGIKCISKCV